MLNLVPTHVDKTTGQLYATLRSVTDGGSPVSGSVYGHVHRQIESSVEWTINHAKGSPHFTFNIFDETGHYVLPDEAYAVDENTVMIKFAVACIGTAVLNLVKE